MSSRVIMIAFLVAAALIALLSFMFPSDAHDIYTGVHGKNGQLCCGGDDCAQTIYREQAEQFFFKTREGTWVQIPLERITFLPIPGDKDDGTENRAHLCYRQATDFDRRGPASSNVFGDIFLYCAFIPPGGS